MKPLEAYSKEQLATACEGIIIYTNIYPQGEGWKIHKISPRGDILATRPDGSGAAAWYGWPSSLATASRNILEATLHNYYYGTIKNVNRLQLIEED